MNLAKSPLARITLVLAAFTICVAAVAQGQTFQTLFTFDNSNGERPLPPMVQGLDGNLYGTADGVTNGHPATIFRITPSGTLTTLYEFPIEGSEGVVLATDGNFYGTTPHGGTSANYL
jgi:uncharacterized repeat protein (TIGR03803 family)